jgi:hypothetical protein
MNGTPEPVAKVTSLEVLALAVVNMVAVTQGWSGEIVAAVNGVVMGAILVLGAFVLRPAVTPIEGLHERLESLGAADGE